MVLLILAALRARVVSMRSAVAVAVLGGVGPFFGSCQLAREQREQRAALDRRARRTGESRRPAQPRSRRVESRKAGPLTANGDLHNSPGHAARDGRSVTEGTVLEWHKAEGDRVEADETLVEISTDKVDAEVPAPVSGTVVKVHVAEGDTVQVGARAGGDPARRRRRADGGRTPTARRRSTPHRRSRRRPRPPTAGRRPRRRPARSSTSSRPPPASRSPRARCSSGTSRSASRSPTATRRRDLDRQGRRRASGARHRRHHRAARRGGETVTVGQVIARMEATHRRLDRDRAGRPRAATPRPRAAPRRGAARRRPTASAPRPSRRASPPPRASTSRAVSGSGPRGRVTKADVLAAKDGGGAAPAAAAPARRGPADPRRRGDARQVHGREPLDPDGDLVPHDHRHGDGRPPQAAQGGRPEGLLHAPDRLRDRARGDRADAGHGAPLRGARRQAAPHRRRRREPRHRGRRREEGRLAHADGAGHPRRRAARRSPTSRPRSTR